MHDVPCAAAGTRHTGGVLVITGWCKDRLSTPGFMLTADAGLTG